MVCAQRKVSLSLLGDASTQEPAGIARPGVGSALELALCARARCKLALFMYQEGTSVHERVPADAHRTTTPGCLQVLRAILTRALLDQARAVIAAAGSGEARLP